MEWDTEEEKEREWANLQAGIKSFHWQQSKQMSEETNIINFYCRKSWTNQQAIGQPVLGKDGISKSDEFLEKFQTAFDPPPSFSENHVALFSGIHDRRSVYNGKNLQHKFLDWK